MRLMLDIQQWERKPTSDEYASLLSPRMRTKHVDVSPQELVEAILQGQAYCPGYMRKTDTRMMDECWVSQQVFVIDSDGGMSMEAAHEICKKYNISPICIHPTFSHTPEKPKFRMVFNVGFEIEDRRVRHLIVHSLLNLFLTQVDNHDYSPCAIYLGTNKPVFHVDYDAILDIPELVLAVVAKIREEDIHGNASRKVAKYCNEIGVATRNTLPIVAYIDCDVSDANPFIYIKGYASQTSRTMLMIEFTKTETDYDYGRKTQRGGFKAGSNGTSDTKTEWKPIRNVDFGKILSTCEACRRFEAGDLTGDCHYLRMAVISNYIHLEGGETRCMDILQKHYGDKYIKHKLDMQYHKAHNYAPWTCKKVECSFECSAKGETIISKAGYGRSSFEIFKDYEPKPQITLEEAEKRLETEIYSLEECYTTIIKAPPGIGKTRHFLNAKTVLYATPSHRLNEDIYGRMVEADNTPLIVPEMPSMDEAFNFDVECYYRIGDTRGANTRKIEKREEIEGKIMLGKPITEQERKFIEYMDAKEKLKSNNETAIITQDRLLHLESIPQDYIIIDEDPFRILLKQSHVSQKELGQLLQISIHTPEVYDIARRINDAVKSGTPIPKFNSDEKNIMRNCIVQYRKHFKSDMLGFMQAVSYGKNKENDDTILFITRRSLPENKSIIILSATVDEAIHKRLLGENIIFNDIGNVKTKGKLIQDISDGWSRESIWGKNADTEKRLKQMKMLAEGRHIITFYKAAKEENMDIKMYYNNLVGLDEYKGKDISIFGTPHVNPLGYLLYAEALGYEVDRTMQPKLMSIEKDWCRFKMMSFEDPDVRAIQIYLIESELIQAIGRARILREDCKVYLHCNYPIESARIIGI